MGGWLSDPTRFGKRFSRYPMVAWPLAIGGLLIALASFTEAVGAFWNQVESRSVP